MNMTTLEIAHDEVMRPSFVLEILFEPGVSRFEAQRVIQICTDVLVTIASQQHMDELRLTMQPNADVFAGFYGFNGREDAPVRAVRVSADDVVMASAD
jgi:hypothetical protein